MLEPADRALLLESLRPPEGYDVDFAIATTYSLDLLSLLIAPLGFTLFEIEAGAETIDSIDPLMLLRTIRRYADRLAVFCQAAQISPPRLQQPLFSSLEDSVVQVTAPIARGIFHPKIWVLRFVGESAPVLYRVICLSRNLTFDRSWDTCLVLDGRLEDRKRAFATNRPLADFVGALPDLAVNKPVAERIRAAAATASNELLRVQFDVPEPFQDYVFYPLGIANYTDSPLECDGDRRLVVSPFLTPKTVQALGSVGRKNVLISRIDALQTLSRKDLIGFSEVYSMNQEVESGMFNEIGNPADAQECRGLHAKIFMTEKGGESWTWTGSANATDAAFKNNVEFLIELVGRKNTCGIASLMEQTGEATFRDLLVPFTPLEVPEVCDSLLQELDERLERIRRIIGRTEWTAFVTSESADLFRLELKPSDDGVPLFEDEVSLRCRPITLPAGRAVALEPGRPPSFGPLSLEALTAFFAFDVDTQSAGIKREVSFVVKAALDGAPIDRRERLLRYHLRDAAQVVRFLLLILALDGDTSSSNQDTGIFGIDGSARTGQAFPTESLLEPLLRALDRRPTLLDQVGETLAELQQTVDGAKIIPPALLEVWDAIVEARRGGARGR